jgi:hypothetical protein
MPNPNQLYEDMQKLDDMYEELLWHPDDELQFSHDGEKIIITNKTLENKQWTKTQNALMVGQQCSEWSQQWDPMLLLVNSFQVSGDTIKGW